MFGQSKRPCFQTVESSHLGAQLSRLKDVEALGYRWDTEHFRN